MRQYPKKPFKIGQLLVKTGWHGVPGIFLVVDCEWDLDYEMWLLDLIQQRYGNRALWMPHGFELAELSND
jgi:hypothetical protein